MQFQFGFMLEEPLPVVVETVEETRLSRTLSKKKPKWAIGFSIASLQRRWQ